MIEAWKASRAQETAEALQATRSADLPVLHRAALDLPLNEYASAMSKPMEVDE